MRYGDTAAHGEAAVVVWLDGRLVERMYCCECLYMPKFHYTNFTETSPKLPRDKSPRLVYDLSPTCLGEVSGK